jgi:hypothetical protein
MLLGGCVLTVYLMVCFCYADDLLLTSLTATGLQCLINVANKYITKHGLRFHPDKTECSMFGPCHLEPRPIWNINETDHVKVTL